MSVNAPKSEDIREGVTTLIQKGPVYICNNCKALIIVEKLACKRITLSYEQTNDVKTCFTDNEGFYCPNSECKSWTNVFVSDIQIKK